MGSLDVYYMFEHDENPVAVSTTGGVDELISHVRTESPDAAPILMEVHLSGGPYSQGLEIGISNDHGVIRYSGREWPEGVISAGENTTDHTERSYFYMGSWRGFPASAEIPLCLIREAVKEFLTTDGARPTCVQWQAEP